MTSDEILDLTTEAQVVLRQLIEKHMAAGCSYGTAAGIIQDALSAEVLQWASDEVKKTTGIEISSTPRAAGPSADTPPPSHPKQSE